MLRSLWQFMRSYNGQGTIAYSYAYIMLGLVVRSPVIVTMHACS